MDKTTHKLKMAKKKAVRATRYPGFELVLNQAHESFVRGRVAIAKAAAELIDTPFNEAPAYSGARQALYRMLPALPVRKRFAGPKVTKNNNPEYRK